jgi:PleD family two-component response regulator
VTCSIGVSGSAGLSAASGDTLVHAADVALYQAKNRGRNQVAQASACELAGVLAAAR